MWKSGKRQDRTSTFSPQPIVDNFRVFHREFFDGFPGTVSTVYFSTMGCGEKSLVLPCFFPLFHIKFPYYGYCYKNL